MVSGVQPFFYVVIESVAIELPVIKFAAIDFEPIKFWNNVEGLVRVCFGIAVRDPFRLDLLFGR